jgi:hypothetical protein
MYCEAEWIPNRVPDEEIPINSALTTIGLSQSKHVTDSTTGKKVIEDIELVKRAREKGIDDGAMVRVSSIVQKLLEKMSSRKSWAPQYLRVIKMANNVRLACNGEVGCLNRGSIYYYQLGRSCWVCSYLLEYVC